MVKTTRQNTPVDRWELASVLAIQCWGLTVNFDGLSNSSLEKCHFPLPRSGRKKVDIVSRVPDPTTKEKKCGVVYKVQCKDCEENFIGETVTLEEYRQLLRVITSGFPLPSTQFDLLFSSTSSTIIFCHSSPPKDIK